ncbi:MULTISPECIES: DUF6186 family protein [unclassified Modestobacter]|uniref:DUF6186 family protein n=1 Tax=unclassified Modestobacter TaxID=2643866 RepID=UPI0022AAF8FA|nr:MULTISPECIES: DUF6186 family protein [unclassified Modestobacter]MCZ2826145.1 DUF6186 family protein [Modestobacter sp. VKM Ac-2981]MCZ2852790.1 DUF6186 family protein [Modestobacter sp. VKM Ac-2982]
MTTGVLLSAAGFLGLLVVGVAIEVCARLGLGPATAGRALGAAMRTTPGRAVVLLTWLWLGVHFLAR